MPPSLELIPRRSQPRDSCVRGRGLDWRRPRRERAASESGWICDAGCVGAVVTSPARLHVETNGRSCPDRFRPGIHSLPGREDEIVRVIRIRVDVIQVNTPPTEVAAGGAPSGYYRIGLVVRDSPRSTVSGHIQETTPSPQTVTTRLSRRPQISSRRSDCSPVES